MTRWGEKTESQLDKKKCGMLFSLFWQLEKMKGEIKSSR
jgi:hypothetical protein